MTNAEKRLGAAAFALAAWISAAAASETVRYATDGYGLGALAIIASRNGYLAEEEIKPIVQYFAAGVDTVDAVLAGQADFGVIMDIPLLTRFAAGKLVSPAIIGVPIPGWHKLYVFAAHQDPQDFKGKKFGVVTGTAQEFISRRYIEQLGLDPGKDVIFVGFGSVFDVVGAMKAGRLDGAWIWGEGVDVIKADRAFRFVGDDSLVKQSSSALLVTSKAYLAEHHLLVVKTLRALEKSSELVAKDSVKAANIVAAATGADAARVKSSIEDQRFGLNFAAGTVASLKAKYDFLVSAHVINPPYDFARQFDITALAEALPGAEIAPLLK